MLILVFTIVLCSSFSFAGPVGLTLAKYSISPQLRSKFAFAFQMSSLGFSELSRSGGSRFELWDEAKSDAYAVETLDAEQRQRWIQRLSRVAPREDQLVRQRPKSWTSTISNDSTCSSSTRSSDSEV